MTRWSLRRRRPQTVDPNNSRPDFSRPSPPRPPDPPAPPSYPRAATFTPLLPEPTFTPRPPESVATSPLPSAWPDFCEQFSLHLLALAEQLRIALDELEADEADPERLQRLYRIDHAATRMRRVSRDLRILAGRAEEELEGPVTSLLDVVRMALSGIERYTQVNVAKIADLAVLGYAADDVGSLMAALLDNATRYSQGPVTVSAHLTGDGNVLFRVEDTGIGMEPDTVASINAMLGGPAGEIDQRTGLRTGFPVVHRIARKHEIGVRLATRPSPASGMIAMVTLPAQMLCEAPDLALAGAAPAPAPWPPAGGVTVLPGGARRRPAGSRRPEPGTRTDWAKVAPREAQWPADEPASAGDLPRREPASLRGDGQRRNGTAGGEPSPALSAQAQAAARRAFADDIAAFSLGSRESTEEGTVP